LYFLFLMLIMNTCWMGGMYVDVVVVVGVFVVGDLSDSRM